jgi:hypothetical protein
MASSPFHSLLQIARACDAFVETYGFTHADTALALKRLHPDVLVDYDGAHDFNNLGTLAALRASAAAGQTDWSPPIVVTLAGFTSTTGMGLRYGRPLIETPSPVPESLASCANNLVPTAIDYSAAGEQPFHIHVVSL